MWRGRGAAGEHAVELLQEVARVQAVRAARHGGGAWPLQVGGSAKWAWATVGRMHAEAIRSSSGLRADMAVMWAAQCIGSLKVGEPGGGGLGLEPSKVRGLLVGKRLD